MKIQLIHDRIRMIFKKKEDSKMGAWGYAYNENDTYQDNVLTYVQPLIAELTNRRTQLEYGVNRGYSQVTDTVDYYTVADDFRGQLYATFKMIQALENVELSPHQTNEVLKTIELVRESVTKTKASWVEPEEYFNQVEKELQEIQEWLRLERFDG